MNDDKTQGKSEDFESKEFTTNHWSGMQTQFQVVSDTSSNVKDSTEKEILFSDLHPVIRAGKRIKSIVRTSIILILLSLLVSLLDKDYERQAIILSTISIGGGIYILTLLHSVGDDLTKFKS
jgi:hypothetical protein